MQCRVNFGEFVEGLTQQGVLRSGMFELVRCPRIASDHLSSLRWPEYRRLRFRPRFRSSDAARPLPARALRCRCAGRRSGAGSRRLGAAWAPSAGRPRAQGAMRRLFFRVGRRARARLGVHLRGRQAAAFAARGSSGLRPSELEALGSDLGENMCQAVRYARCSLARKHQRRWNGDSPHSAPGGGSRKTISGDERTEVGAIARWTWRQYM